MAKARLRETEADFLKKLSKQRKEQFARERALVAGVPSFGSNILGGTGNRGNSTNQQPQKFLKAGGDTMIGAFATYPVSVLVSSGEIDISRDGNNFSSNVIVTGADGVNDDVDTITGAAFAGQWMLLQAVLTTDITLKHLTGNIFIPGGSDYTVTGGENVLLKFDSVNNRWVLVANFNDPGAVSGANTSLSNLTTTSINESLVPGTSSLDLGGGAANEQWDVAFINRINFLNNTVFTTGTASIGTESGGEIVLNAPTSQSIHGRVDGGDTWETTDSTFAISSGKTLSFIDGGANATISKLIGTKLLINTTDGIELGGGDVDVSGGDLSVTDGDLFVYDDTTNDSRITMQYGAGGLTDQYIDSDNSGVTHAIASGNEFDITVAGTQIVVVNDQGLEVTDGHYIQPPEGDEIAILARRFTTPQTTIGSRGTILVPNDAVSIQPSDATLDSKFGDGSGANGVLLDTTESEGSGKYRVWKKFGTDWCYVEYTRNPSP